MDGNLLELLSELEQEAEDATAGLWAVSMARFGAAAALWSKDGNRSREVEMLARVARFEGAEAADMEDTAARIREDAGSGPPEGVPAKGLLLLQDTEGGRALAIALFESEEDYRQGHETLEAMNPPGGGMGRRVSVEKYEVAVQLEA